uniref:Band 7 domain-containing protein n=1 Tax=Meloidogyne javanica TaxID=6303 RepID=A0A915MFY1_MELJA
MASSKEQRGGEQWVAPNTQQDVPQSADYESLGTFFGYALVVLSWVVIFRIGRLIFGGARGPGMIFVIPCIDTYRKIDLRVVSYAVPPQEILSKDSVTVSVDAVVYFRTSDPIASVSFNKNIKT